MPPAGAGTNSHVNGEDAATLFHLTRHWGGVYTISLGNGTWHARHVSADGTVTELFAADGYALRRLMQENHSEWLREAGKQRGHG